MHSKFQLALFFGGHCTQLGATLREINVIESNCLSISPHITPKINYKTRGNRQPVGKSVLEPFFPKKLAILNLNWLDSIHSSWLSWKIPNRTIFTITWSRWATSSWILKNTSKFTISSSDFSSSPPFAFFVVRLLFNLFNLDLLLWKW